LAVWTQFTSQPAAAAAAAAAAVGDVTDAVATLYGTVST